MGREGSMNVHCARIGLASSLEGDSDERFSKNTVENAVAQGTVLFEDFTGRRGLSA